MTLDRPVGRTKLPEAFQALFAGVKTAQHGPETTPDPRTVAGRMRSRVVGVLGPWGFSAGNLRTSGSVRAGERS